MKTAKELKEKLRQEGKIDEDNFEYISQLIIELYIAADIEVDEEHIKYLEKLYDFINR